MANGFRGQSTFKVGLGPEAQEFTLVYDANAFCEIEEALSTPGNTVGINELMQLLQSGMSMIAFRAVFAGGLRKHHQLSLEAAGDLISDVGFEEAAKAVGEAITRAMPDTKRGPGADGKAGNAPRGKQKGGAGKPA